tara:strand:+ start:651 stop:1028 length:378 start_codon:yes stop_codon:yes gene_type:complete
MASQTLLSVGDKWFSYSGLLLGDASVPATIELINIPNTGLRDSLMKTQPFFGLPPNVNPNEGLGIQINIDDVIVYEFKPPDPYYRNIQTPIDLFVPRQSKVTILSLNTSGNNSQARGCTTIGYYL